MNEKLIDKYLRRVFYDTLFSQYIAMSHVIYAHSAGVHPFIKKGAGSTPLAAINIMLHEIEREIIQLNLTHEDLLVKQQ